MRALADRAGVACHAVLVETPERECRARNRARPEAVPSSLITSQLRAMTATITAIEARDSMQSTARRTRPSSSSHTSSTPPHSPPSNNRRIPCPCASGCRSVASRGPADRPRRRAASGHDRGARRGGRFQLDLRDGPLRSDPERRSRMGGHAREHRCPRLPGGVDEISRLGTLVTGITYRNIAHVAKIVATLDVLSGGRAFCGLGTALVPARARAVRLGLPADPQSATTAWRTRCSCCR